MKNLLFAFITHQLSLITPLLAQPSIGWQKCLGGNSIETAYASQQTADGGYVIAGSAFSINNGDVMGVHGGGDFWVVKLDSTGAIEWQNPLGGSTTEIPYSIKQTSDGGYIVAGRTYSSDGDVSGYHGSQDGWIVKLSHAGAIEWQKALGGSNYDDSNSVEQTSDGGYIVAGSTFSTDGDALSEGKGLIDTWVIKLSESGSIQWEKKYGGSSSEFAYSIRQASDGGYVFAGLTTSNDGDVSGHNGNDDFWVVKIDTAGVIEWQKALGGIGADGASDVHPTADGGYVVTGYAGSGNTGQVSGWQGLWDFWVVKLSGLGELQWQKSLGGSDSDGATSIHQTNDGGYVVAGSTQSLNGDVQGNLNPGVTAWVVKLSSVGELQWQKPMGGIEWDEFFAAQQTSDGGYLLVGNTASNDGDVSGNHGDKDFWIVKLAPESVGTEELLTPVVAGHLDIYPNPATSTIFLQVATSSSFVETMADREPTLRVHITDLLGREMLRQELANGGSIDIALLPSGVYFAKAATPLGKAYVGKVIKE